MRVLWISGLAVQALPFTLAQAQTPVEGEETAIDTIVVTGTRIEQTTAEAGSTVRVIDAERLEDLGFDHALDAIATTPGVTINQNGAFGGSATVRIRGASSDQTLVLIDGVSVNDASSPGGGFNFARMDTAHIERIEILSGPQSTLWGTDAIGGVVSIITKRPDEGLSGGLFGQTGSFGAFRGGASVSHGGDTGDFRLAATQLYTDGISRADERNGNTEDDGFDSLTLSAQGGLNLPGGARIDTSVLWNDSQAEFDSFRAGAQGSVGDGDEVSETMERSAHVSLTAPLFGGRLDNRLLIGRAEIDRQNLSNGTPSFSAKANARCSATRATWTSTRATPLLPAPNARNQRPISTVAHSMDCSPSTNSGPPTHSRSPAACAPTITIASGRRPPPVLPPRIDPPPP